MTGLKLVVVDKLGVVGGGRDRRGVWVEFMEACIIDVEEFVRRNMGGDNNMGFVVGGEERGVPVVGVWFLRGYALLWNGKNFIF